MPAKPANGLSQILLSSHLQSNDGGKRVASGLSIVQKKTIHSAKRYFSPPQRRTSLLSATRRLLPCLNSDRRDLSSARATAARFLPGAKKRRVAVLGAANGATVVDRISNELIESPVAIA